MPKLMKILLYCTTLLVLTLPTSALLEAQSSIDSVQIEGSTQVDLMRSLLLERDSKSESIRISVNNEVQRLDLMINARVGEGKLTIEIYSPSGKKEWNMTVGSQTNSNKREEVSGSIKKMLIEPDAGDWIVKLKPENATASIEILTKSVEN